MLTTTESTGLTLRLAMVCSAYHLRRRHHWVDDEMRHRAVAAAAAQRDTHFVGGGHHRSGAHRHLSGRQARPVVQGVHLGGGEALEQSFPDHDLAAAAAFLGGLEHEVRGAGEVAGLREIARRPEQHRGVAIVAAGVHAARVSRAVLEGVAFLDRKAIHVGAKRDAFRAVLPARNDADHPGLGEPGMRFDAQLAQIVGDDPGCSLLLEGQFRMRVNVAPDAGQLGLPGADAIDGTGHVGRRRRRGSTA
jgi:hypothetical protein